MSTEALTAPVRLVVPGIIDPNTLVCLARATRKFSQYCKAVDDALAGKCPFCEIDHNYNKVILEGQHCLAWPCNPPEKNTRLHFLIVPRRHVKSLSELSEDELLSLWNIKSALEKIHGFTSCGVLIRDGDATLSAGTSQHLHMHVMVPNGTGRVESPFYKGADEEAQGVARAIVFEKIRTGTQPSTLTDEEKALIKDRV